MIWYVILTLFSLGISILLFVSYKISACNIELPGIVEITLWIEIILQSIFKLLTIVFFRFDLVYNRATIRHVILYKPFILSLIIITTGPAALLPVYTFNFDLCYDRNILLGISRSWPL